MNKLNKIILALALTGMCTSVVAAGDSYKPKIDPKAKLVEYDDSIFGDDPSYDLKEYDVEAQLKIYGGKTAYEVTRPLLELGREIYTNETYSESSYIFGATNPVDSQLAVYGDWRTAIAFNDNKGVSESLIATRLNLDIDWRLTGTERFHAVITPLEDDGAFTRQILDSDVNERTLEIESDGSLDALYFEGDLGNIAAGFAGTYSKTDIPFAIGLMPLFFQNGIWLDDAFTGVAVTIPHMNSGTFDITNMDITFFAGFDEVNSAVNPDEEASIFGVTAFIEANQGYWEMGYGFTDAGDGALDDHSYHNVAIAFSKRYAGLISNSIRLIHNFGQEDSLATKTADGTLLLIENSWITSLPSTLVPYANFFIGDGTPQSLARNAGAGGILKNTGINFETDGLTGFPTLRDDAADAMGGAIGVNYLFGLDQQLVIEAAFVADQNDNVSVPDEFGLGVRYQRPLDTKWIFRADAMFATTSFDAVDDSSGARLEIRRKF